MKKIFAAVSLLYSMVYAQEPAQEKVFFTNSLMSENYFYSEVTYQSPSWLRNSNGKLTVSDKNFTPGNALELEYVSAAKGIWEGKIFYNTIRGIDAFKQGTHIIFYMYVESETTTDQLPSIAVSEKDKEHSSILPLKSYIVQFQKGKWIRIAIPIKDFGTSFNPANLSTIIFRQPSTPVAAPSDTILHQGLH